MGVVNQRPSINGLRDQVWAEPRCSKTLHRSANGRDGQRSTTFTSAQLTVEDEQFLAVLVTSNDVLY
jgi:hypothetical protein